MQDKAYDRLPTERSRALRNNPTEAERKLWSVIRNRKLGGVRFNRQLPIGPYICDFVARSAGLIIEVDGGQHAIDTKRDEARSRFLKAQGYRVIRFWNDDVLSNVEGVVMAIMDALENPPSRFAGGEEGRSPEGEGLSYTETTCPPPTPPAKREGSKK